MDELQLIERCKQNDRAAQKAIYGLHKDKLYTVAYRITNDFDIASDILQMAFIDVFKSVDKLNEPKYFYPWVKKMVIRKAYRHVTKKQESISLDSVDDRQLMTAEPGDIEYIEQAIRSLPYKSRTVFVMAEVEGYKHKEIAEALDISVGTSKSQLNYAKNKLKNLLSKYLVG